MTFAIVAWEISIAVATLCRLPPRSVTSEASIATSVPVPIAIPTSAWVSAGASLMPSPTIADPLALALQLPDLVRLVLRQHLREHPVHAHLTRDRLRCALDCRR